MFDKDILAKVAHLQICTDFTHPQSNQKFNISVENQKLSVKIKNWEDPVNAMEFHGLVETNHLGYFLARVY